MIVKKIKYWTKTIQQDTIDHVTIIYQDLEKEVSLHQFGEKAIAAPEFYVDIENFSDYICRTCGLDESLSSAIAVKEIVITESEDKDGNDNTVYKFVCSLKASHASAAITVSIQHKFIPEGFNDAMQQIIENAKEYVGGKRGQTELFKSDKEEDGSDEDEAGEDNSEDSYNGE